MTIARAAALLLVSLALPLSAADPEKELEKAVKKSPPDVAAFVEACEALRAAPSEKGVKALVKFGPAIPNADVYLAARDALAAAKEGKALEELLESAKKGKPEQRVLCLDALAYHASDAAVEALAGALDAKEQPVRTTAIRGLARMKRKEGIPRLFGRFAKLDPKSTDAEVDELYKALKALTGQQLETLDDWKKWWSTVEQDFDPSKVGQVADGGTRQRATGKIFDSEVRSKKFVLCLDVSSSMRVIDLEPGKTWKDPKGQELPYEDPGVAWPPKEGSRFARARSEFLAFIAQLDPSVNFTIVTFSDETKAWQEKLVPATEANKKSASDFVSKMQWGPATRTDMALERCFAFAEADTIYFFSDGIPEKPKPTGGTEPIPQDEVLKLARTLNRVRKARLNTFGFATVSPQTREFLRTLGAENEGEYKDIR